MRVVDAVSLFTGEILRVVGVEGVDLPEAAVRDQFAHVCHVREEPRPHGLDHCEARSQAEFDDVGSLCVRESERLLDEDVFAVFEREPCVFGVQVVWRCDVNHVDVRVGSEVLIRTMGLGNPMGCRESLRGRERTRPDSRHPVAVCGQVSRERSGDASRCEDPPTNHPVRSWERLPHAHDAAR